MPWAVVVTWPMYERRVEAALKQQGFQCYLPRCKVAKPKSRSTLLFPRYLFAGPSEEWSALRRVYGVARLLRSGDHPAVVQDQELARLRAQENPDGVIELSRPTRPRIGQIVRIMSGAFAGQKGTYQGQGRRNFERVETALGPTELPVGNLVPVE